MFLWISSFSTVKITYFLKPLTVLIDISGKQLSTNSFPWMFLSLSSICCLIRKIFYFSKPKTLYQLSSLFCPFLSTECEFRALGSFPSDLCVTELTLESLSHVSQVIKMNILWFTSLFFFRGIFHVPRSVNNAATVITDTLQSLENNIFKHWVKISFELISSWTGWDNLSGDWGDSKRVKMRYIILDFKTAFSLPCLSHLLLYGPNIQPVCYIVSWLLYGGSSCTPKNHCAPSAAIDFSGDWVNWVPACRFMPNCKLDKGTQAHVETACFPLLWTVECMACSGQISSADRSFSIGLTAFACQDGWSDT